MPSLVWSEALSLSMPVMDQTHQEFVELLAKAASSDDEHLVDRWQHLIAHTQDHFDREDAWMQASGFAPVNCHSTQHAVVLKVLKEGLAAGEQGSLNTIRMMAHELGIWFAQHAQTMDAALPCISRAWGSTLISLMQHLPAHTRGLPSPAAQVNATKLSPPRPPQRLDTPPPNTAIEGIYRWCQRG